MYEIYVRTTCRFPMLTEIITTHLCPKDYENDALKKKKKKKDFFMKHMLSNLRRMYSVLNKYICIKIGLQVFNQGEKLYRSMQKLGHFATK